MYQLYKTHKHTISLSLHSQEYDWNQQTQSTILSSFFWGYVITQIPAGQIAERFGPKMIIFFAMLISSLLTMVTPLCASYGGWQLLCAVRVAEGLCQGVLFPSSHALLSKWAPASERGQLTTYCYSGSQFGTVLMLAVSGVLASSSLGWPSVFYLPGGIGCAWAALWLMWGSNAPSECAGISSEERAFIEESNGARNKKDKLEKCSGDGGVSPSRVVTPWRSIFTSLPFWSLILVHAGHNWGYWTLLTKIPVYMKFILKLDLKSNALLSSLPYLAMLIMCFVFSWLADVLMRRDVVPLRISRKVFNSIGEWWWGMREHRVAHANAHLLRYIGHWVPMVALIGLGYVAPDNHWMAILLLTIAVGINAATYLGFQVSVCRIIIFVSYHIAFTFANMSRLPFTDQSHRSGAQLRGHIDGHHQLCG